MASPLSIVCSRIEKNDSDFKDLDLSGKTLFDNDIEELSKSLANNDTLMSLELTGNSFTFEGLDALFTGLMHCTNLQALYVNWNTIAAVGDDNNYNELFEKLRYIESLITLDISYTNIGEKGIEALYNVLPYTEITTLYAIGNGFAFDEEQKIKFRSILDQNRAKFDAKFWIPWFHMSFTNNDESCHQMVMASLLCNSQFSKILPMHIWIDIFSFWQRKKFKNLSDDDDFSDEDYDEDDEDDEDYDDEDDEDDEDN